MCKLLRSSLLILLSVLFVADCFAQQYYNQTSRYIKSNSVWNFFQTAKLNFNTGTVSYNTPLFGGEEGCASVSDPITGALLFYSDGGRCWNSNNTIMPNGNGLLGNPSGSYSTAQGVCIVPVPEDANKYYLFSLEGTDGNPSTAFKLYYSIVDMSLNNGAGDIVSSGKNIVLDSNSLYSECMLAVQGDNCDLWLVLHMKNTPVFKSYHITASGIDPNPVLSTTGAQIQGTSTLLYVGDINAYDQTTLAISPDRNKLALSCLHLGATGFFSVTASTGRTWGGLLCDFDAATGAVSNAILFDTLGVYNAAFSPDNSKLYYTTIAPFSASSQVKQVTVTSNDSATISLSKVVVQQAISTGLSGQPIGMRAYNDSIYIINHTNLTLDRINKPNLTGAACDYQSNAIAFPGATKLGSTLPNEVVYAAGPDTVRSRILDTLVCGSWNNGITIRPADNTIEDNYTWSNATTDTILAVTAPGTYWVKYGNTCHYRVDTFVLKGSDLEPIITVNVFQLSTTMPYTTYQWYLNNVLIPGATGNVYTVTQNGAYTVVVSDGTCTDTSAVYNVSNVTGIDDRSRLGNQIKVYPNPATDIVYINSPIAVNAQLTGIEGKTIRTVKNAREIVTGDLAAGVYLLRLTDKDGIVLKVEKLIREK